MSDRMDFQSALFHPVLQAGLLDVRPEGLGVTRREGHRRVAPPAPPPHISGPGGLGVTTDPITDFSSDAETSFEELDSGERRAATGSARGTRLAPAEAQPHRARVRRLFLLLMLVALLAPVYAAHVADTTPDRQRIADTINIDGKEVQVVSVRRRPDRPDVARRVLPRRRRQRPRRHGAPALRRPQLTLHRHLRHAHHDVPGRGLRHARGLLPRRRPTRIISRALDVLWAFPVLLLGVALGVSLATGGLHIGPLSIENNSLWIPTLIIGVVNVVYLARPVRGQVLSLREREFVEAARAQGAGALRIMFSELPPNLILDGARLLPAPRRQRGAPRGRAVVPRRRRPAAEPVLGHDDQRRPALHRQRPALTIAPGLMLVLTVLSLNIFGEGVRDAARPAGASPPGALSHGPFIIRRLFAMVFVMFAVSVLTFLIFNVIPNGDPAARMAGKNSTPAADRGDPRGLGLRRAALAAVPQR